MTRAGSPAGPQARRSERRAFELCCQVIGKRGHLPRVQYASDVSRGGMWLRTLLPLEVGEQVVVTLPDRGDEVCLFGEVVRTHRPGGRRDTRRPGMAVRFCGMTIDEQRRLDRYIDGLPPNRTPVLDVLAWHLRKRAAQPH
jgi:hypothetical protein